MDINNINLVLKSIYVYFLLLTHFATLYVRSSLKQSKAKVGSR